MMPVLLFSSRFHLVASCLVPFIEAVPETANLTLGTRIKAPFPFPAQSDNCARDPRFNSIVQLRNEGSREIIGIFQSRPRQIMLQEIKKILSPMNILFLISSSNVHDVPT
jgi:hypothetical protein